MREVMRVEDIRWMRCAIVLALASVGAFILWPLFDALICAGVLSILSMPIYSALLVRFPRHTHLLPILIILGWMVILFGPVFGLLLKLQAEASIAYQYFPFDFFQPSGELTMAVGRIPLVGPMMVDFVAAFPREAHEMLGLIKNLIPLLGKSLGRLLIALSDQLLQLFTTVVALYFFLREGERITQSLKRGLIRILRTDVTDYFTIIQSTVYAVSLGIMGGALLQGLIATVGYLIFGVKTPLLLGLLSVIASLIPVVGAFLVWGPLVMVFILENHYVHAVGLALWGLVIVHPADNLLRPWVIGKLMHTPILLMILGVVGGILTLGFTGLFLGPCILALLFHLWNSLSHHEKPESIDA